MRDKKKISLRGELCDVRMQQSGRIAEPASLNVMAREALNYLENNPNPELDYECRFAIYPSHIPYHAPFFPPTKYAFDAVSLADTDVRMQYVWDKIRYMAGIAEPSEAELRVKERCASYAKPEGGCYANPAAYTGCEVEGEWISPWGTSNHLMYLCDLYEEMGDSNILSTIKKSLDILWSYTVSVPGMTDFPHGTPVKDGKWLDIGWAKEHQNNHVFILEPLIRYYEITGDSEYKRRAILIAEAYLNCMIDTRGANDINPENGSFEGHVHTHTRCCMVGMAHLACLTGDSRYFRYAKNIFDFIISNSPGFGWYAEYSPTFTSSETCVNGDMVWTAYYLALCGELGFYDEMEKNWRNYLRVTQFYVTDDVKSFIRLVNQDASEEALAAAFEKLKKLEGGFIAQVTWNDLTHRHTLMDEGRGNKMLYMMGCCPPSAMLAMHYIFKAAAMKKQDGIYINMSISADTPYARLTTDYSSAGKLKVEAMCNSDYYIRVPEWTDYGEVRLFVNNKPCEVIWDGPQCRYLAVHNVKEGDIICIDYPLVRFTQKICNASNTEYSFEWLGNSVLEVSPKAEYIDLFGEQRGIH